MFVGCQFSLYPMTDRFVDVILGAVNGLGDRDDLRVETDDLSTLIVGAPAPMFAAVERCFLTAAKDAEHVVLNATFSRGCPGEPDDPLCTPEGPASQAPAPLDLATVPRAGVDVAAQFALYPLGIPEYMDVIYHRIEAAKQAGAFAKGKNFCTRLHGDASHVFATLQDAFDQAATSAGHVVVTATVSKGSPTTT